MAMAERTEATTRAGTGFSGDGAMGLSPRRISRELVKLFEGDVSAAEEAIAHLMENPGVVEAWATKRIEESAYEDFQRDYRLFEKLAGTGGLAFGGERLSAFEQREREGLKHIVPFSFAELPRGVRDAGLRGLVISYLVHTGARDGPFPKQSVEVDFE